jgi:hypothetical protein
VTAAAQGSAIQESRLPLWRLVTGLAVLGTLVALLVVAAIVYVDNFRLHRYMDALVDGPASAVLSDSALRTRVVERAKELDLPVVAGDVSVSRVNGKPRIKIARFGVQTYLVRMDLRLPEFESH